MTWARKIKQYIRDLRTEWEGGEWTKQEESG